MFEWRSIGLVGGRQSIVGRDLAVVTTALLSVLPVGLDSCTHINNALATFALLKADNLQ